MSNSNNYENNGKEPHRRVVEHKKYVKDEKYVRDHGIEKKIYVTAVDGIVKKYVIKSVSRSDPGNIGCKNRHLGSLHDFDFLVNTHKDILHEVSTKRETARH
jgi:hypothetical protein